MESRFAAERQFGQLLDANAALGKEIETLKKLQIRAENAKKCIGEVKIDGSQAQSALSAMRQSFEVIRTSSPTTFLRENGQDSEALSDFKRSLWDSDRIYEKFYECTREINAQIRTEIAGSSLRVDEEILSTTSFDNARQIEEHPAPNSIRFVQKLRRPTIIRSELSELDIKSVASELAKLAPQAWTKSFEDSRQSSLIRIIDVLAKTASEIEARQVQVKRNEGLLANLDKVLATKQSSQSILDQSLVYSIYGMILALTILFISLRFFPETLAIHMVQDRSLVEVMSMAFILLTIIILGTGEKIGKETLGTLLGTIAGYIFGRKLGESEGRAETQRAPNQTQAKPPS